MEELSWSTFIFEIVNFLILIWLLTRFLYRPVMAVIERRREKINAMLGDAQQQREDARRIEEQFTGRLEAWEREKSAAREALENELQQERVRLTAELERTLEEQREKSRVLEERRLSDLKHKLEQAALEQGAEFVATLLRRVSSPELEQQLVSIALEDLGTLPTERVQDLRSILAKSDASVIVNSAFALNDNARTEIETRLASVLSVDKLSCRFVEDSTLIAGLRVCVGPWVLRANLRDELRYFAEASGDAGK